MTRDEIVKRPRRTQKEMIPDFGDVYFRVLKVSEISDWHKKSDAAKKTDSTLPMVLIVALSLCDPEGKPIFGVGELAMIGETLDWPVIKAMADKALELNQLNDKTPTVEQAAKNS